MANVKGPSRPCGGCAWCQVLAQVSHLALASLGRSLGAALCGPRCLPGWSVAAPGTQLSAGAWRAPVSHGAGPGAVSEGRVEALDSEISEAFEGLGFRAAPGRATVSFRPETGLPGSRVLIRRGLDPRRFRSWELGAGRLAGAAFRGAGGQGRGGGALIRLAVGGPQGLWSELP